MNFFSINISSNNNRQTYINIGKILNLSPCDGDHYNINNPEAEWISHPDNKRYSLWVFSIDIKDENSTSLSIDKLLDLIEPNIDELEKIGIKKNDMFFLLNTNFDMPSSFKLNPKTMRRLGKTDIEIFIDLQHKTIVENPRLPR